MRLQTTLRSYFTSQSTHPSDLASGRAARAPTPTIRAAGIVPTPIPGRARSRAGPSAAASTDRRALRPHRRPSGGRSSGRPPYSRTRLSAPPYSLGRSMQANERSASMIQTLPQKPRRKLARLSPCPRRSHWPSSIGAGLAGFEPATHGPGNLLRSPAVSEKPISTRFLSHP